MSLPETMRVVEIASFGGPEVLTPAERPVPKPGPGEVLIKVAAAGVNRPDISQRVGAYPPPPGASDLPGLEVAGTVAAVGEGVRRWAEGDPVCALTPGGGYAEYCLTPQEQCLPIPEGYDMVKAACLPETFFTVYLNVFMRVGLKAGEKFLVHGGSSGIGTTAIQLARAFGATVFTTAGSDEKVKACTELGAHHAINYRSQDWKEAIKEATDGKGVDVILDMVGGDYIQSNIDSLAFDGRLAIIAYLQGSKREVDFIKVLGKRLTISGSTLRPQPISKKAEIAANLQNHVWPLLTSGKVAPVLFKTFTLEQASDAHSLMESSDHIGKIILTMD